jgi:formylglycine-generating enzyme required for sulfatase activity
MRLPGSPFVPALALLVACGAEAEPRAELVVTIDTNLPLAGQLVGSKYSSDSAVDTLRIQVFSADAKQLFDERELVVPETANWPVSFGIAGAGASRVVVRARAFRGIFARRSGNDPKVAPDPPPEATVDRVLVVDLPEAGIARAGIVLDAECRGMISSFKQPFSTCVDRDRPEASAEISDGELGPTRAGSWSPALDVDCTAAPKPGTKCIPGGFSLLGDLDLPNEDIFAHESRPLRPVLVAPFFLDEVEVTVGRFRQIAPSLTTAPPWPHDPSHPLDRFCTWTADPGPFEAHAIVCIDPETAAQVCDRLGGFLPTEAQWEHAARGRGQRRRFPWGDDAPSCCRTSAGRYGPERLCAQEPEGPEPVGSHPGSPTCGGDVSRDGVLDLAGGVVEMLADSYQSFDAACWQWPGVARDPKCDAAGGDRSARGGSWETGFLVLQSALRDYASTGQTVGFRCAYPDSP